ncbi:hypothetical protein NEF87_000463 [Candidatus Lokiarchaeum ossiferum]|uniref:Uncharacterized protein n=1 Tax=Candidatus Lokiarchaeum ossiferum TaxID=2951803 RepID=A0ABY6HLI6_9ARCH|nr:hypothetical protein NEF87_000463 [Candidatus Lokiarchaeum sp. B-35]
MNNIYQKTRKKLIFGLLFGLILNQYISTSFLTTYKPLDDEENQTNYSSFLDELTPLVNQSSITNRNQEDENLIQNTPQSPAPSLLEQIYRGKDQFTGFIKNEGQLGDFNSYVEYYHNYEKGKLGFGRNQLHYVYAPDALSTASTSFSVQFLEIPDPKIQAFDQKSSYHNILTANSDFARLHSYETLKYTSPSFNIETEFFGGDHGNINGLIKLPSISALKQVVIRTSAGLSTHVIDNQIQVTREKSSEVHQNPLLSLSEIYAFSEQGELYELGFIQLDSLSVGFQLMNIKDPGPFYLYFGSILPGMQKNSKLPQFQSTLTQPWSAADDEDPPIITNVNYDPQDPTPLDNVKIVADIEDISGISLARVYYRASTDYIWHNSTMIFDTGTTYNAFIGYFEMETYIDYFIEAFDNSVAYNSINSTTEYFYIDVIDDENPPEVSNIQVLPLYPNDQDSILIQAEIIDINSFSAVVQYRNKSNVWNNADMNHISGNIYQTSISNQTGFVEYNFWVQDNSMNMNSAVVKNSSENFNFTSVDTQPPVFKYQSIVPGFPTPDELVTITTSIEDKGQMQNVTIIYQVNSGQWQRKNMTKKSDSLYDYIIGPFVLSDHINYYFEAYDTLNHQITVDNSGMFYYFDVEDRSTAFSDSFCSYFGAGAHSKIKTLQVDSDGFIYIAGSTQSYNFPSTPGSFQETGLSEVCAFITKLTPDGREMIFSTLIGSSTNAVSAGNETIIEDIALDSSKNIYAVGSTMGHNFPIQGEDGKTPVQEYWTWGLEGFLLKLKPDGTELSFSTFIGASTGHENITAVILDELRNIYVTGSSTSSDMQTTDGAYRTSSDFTLPAGNASGILAKISPDGTTYEFLTYLGGERDFRPMDIALDSQKNIFVVGNAECGMMDCTIGRIGPYREGFITEISNDGTSLIMQRFTIGNESEYIESIVISKDDYPIVAGYTNSSRLEYEFGGLYSENMGGKYDGFILTLKNDSSGEICAGTFIGSDQNDQIYSLSLDPQNSVYVGGITTSTNLTLTTNAFQSTHGGRFDNFLYRLDFNLTTILYGSYFGGNSTDILTDMVLDPNYFAYFVGETNSPNLATQDNALQSTYQSESSYLLKITPQLAETSVMLSSPEFILAELGSSFNISLEVQSFTGIFNASIHYTLDNQNWITILAERKNLTHYSASLGPFTAGSKVKYYLEVRDLAAPMEPVINNNSNQFYHIIYPQADSSGDFSSPNWNMFEAVQDKNILRFTGNATDLNDIAVVKLHYSVDGGDEKSFICQEIEKTYNEGEIKWEVTYQAILDFLSFGVDVEYWFQILDNSLNHNSINYPIYHISFEETDIIPPNITELTLSPISPTQKDEILVTVTIRDENSIGYTFIRYSLNGGVWQEQTLQALGNDRFQANLGKFQEFTSIKYFIGAYDLSVNSNYQELNNEGQNYTVQICYLDEIKPEILNLNYPTEPMYTNQQISIQFDVFDISNISQVEIFYQYMGENWNSSILSLNQSNHYDLEFNTGEIRNEFQFYLRVVDNSSLHLSKIYNNQGVFYKIPILSRETGSIWLDHSTNGNEFSNIRVFDQDQNLNRREIDYITVNVTSSVNLVEKEIPLYESGLDTGVFVGILWYSPFNENLDIQIENSANISIQYIDPSSNELEIQAITYNFQWYATSIARLTFDKMTYSFNESILTSIIDLDANNNSTEIDTAYVRIRSTLDRNGFLLPLTETHPNSSVFFGAFSVNEQETRSESYEIFCWDGWNVFAEYSDTTPTDTVQSTLTEEIKYLSDSSQNSFHTTIFPIQPKNGDLVRFIISVPLRMGVEEITIHTEQNQIILNKSYSSIYETVFVGWILAEEEDLKLTYHIKLKLLDGELIESKDYTLDLLPAKINFQCHYEQSGSKAKFALLSFNSRDQPLPDVEYNIWGYNLNNYQYLDMVVITSESGISTFYLDPTELDLSIGSYNIWFEVSKPDYDNVIIEYMIEIVYGIPMHRGRNAIEIDYNLKISSVCTANCWLVLDVMDTPDLSKKYQGYSSLPSTFLAMYIYQDSPKANWPVTSITIDTATSNGALWQSTYDFESGQFITNDFEGNVEVVEKNESQWKIRNSYMYKGYWTSLHRSNRIYLADQQRLVTTYYSSDYQYSVEKLNFFATYGVIARSEFVNQYYEEDSPYYAASIPSSDSIISMVRNFTNLSQSSNLEPVESDQQKNEIHVGWEIVLGVGLIGIISSSLGVLVKKKRT